MTLTPVLEDKPLLDPQEDLLGYAPFAKNFAEILSQKLNGNGCVFALYGPWGAGKTTCLNFVLHYINENKKGQAPVIIRFNPWWFSGQSDLIGHFFRELQAALKNRFGEKFYHLISQISDFASVISDIPEPTGLLKISSRVLIAFNRQVNNKKDAWELKESISKELRKQNQRFLIVIDDIDRLSKGEIKELFRLIKSIADFPNMDYLLVFDKDVVTKALKGFQSTSGEEYLSKIVQVALDLPLHERT